LWPCCTAFVTAAASHYYPQTFPAIVWHARPFSRFSCLPGSCGWTELWSFQFIPPTTSCLV